MLTDTNISDTEKHANVNNKNKNSKKAKTTNCKYFTVMTCVFLRCKIITVEYISLLIILAIVLFLYSTTIYLLW